MIDKRGCIHQTIGYCMWCQQWADEHKGKAPTLKDIFEERNKMNEGALMDAYEYYLSSYKMDNKMKEFKDIHLGWEGDEPMIFYKEVESIKTIRPIPDEPKSIIVSKKEWFAYVVTAIIAGLAIVTLIALVV